MVMAGMTCYNSHQGQSESAPEYQNIGAGSGQGAKEDIWSSLRKATALAMAGKLKCRAHVPMKARLSGKPRTQRTMRQQEKRIASAHASGKYIDGLCCKVAGCKPCIAVDQNPSQDIMRYIADS